MADIKEIGGKALSVVREAARERIDDVADEVFIDGIQRATSAMVDLKTPDDKIVEMLIYHWDLSPSEARWFLEERKRINAGKAKRAAEQKKVNAPLKK